MWTLGRSSVAVEKSLYRSHVDLVTLNISFSSVYEQGASVIHLWRRMAVKGWDVAQAVEHSALKV